MGYPVHVHAMAGLGDTIYQRPLIRALASAHREIYVQTPWPELLADIPGVKCTYPHGIGLRTQEKNAERQGEAVYHAPPLKAAKVRPRYRLKQDNLTIVRELLETMRLHPRTKLVWDLPDFEASPVRYTKTPVAVLRPVTLRREWLTPARAPDPGYIAEAARILKDRGYAVVAVADTNGVDEWLEGELPEIDKTFLAGELDVTELVSLVHHAEVLVGGVGWIVPFGIASATPTVVVGGGLGGHNAPEVITDRRMDTSRIRFVLPAPYCRCRSPRHDCNKRIPGFGEKFEAALDEAVGEEAVAA